MFLTCVERRSVTHLDRWIAMTFLRGHFQFVCEAIWLRFSLSRRDRGHSQSDQPGHWRLPISELEHGSGEDRYGSNQVMGSPPGIEISAICQKPDSTNDRAGWICDPRSPPRERTSARFA